MHYFFSVISVSIMKTFVLTDKMLLVHSGYCFTFFKLWLGDFLVGCLIGIPTGLLIVPIRSKWFNLHTENKKSANN